MTIRRNLVKKPYGDLIFEDFNKTFDSINRNKMPETLRAQGVPEKIVNAVGQLYRDTEAQVSSPDRNTNFFKILAGGSQEIHQHLSHSSS